MYYIVVMVLLSVALINYLYRNDEKSMLFLISSISFFLLEIMGVARFSYNMDSINLVIVNALILIIAYLQSQLEYAGSKAKELL